jgi:hypothetical protein
MNACRDSRKVGLQVKFPNAAMRNRHADDSQRFQGIQRVPGVIQSPEYCLQNNLREEK